MHVKQEHWQAQAQSACTVLAGTEISGEFLLNAAAAKLNRMKGWGDNTWSGRAEPPELPRRLS
jgi:hypothetical protein